MTLNKPSKDFFTQAQDLFQSIAGSVRLGSQASDLAKEGDDPFPDLTRELEKSRRETERMFRPGYIKQSIKLLKVELQKRKGGNPAERHRVLVSLSKLLRQDGNLVEAIEYEREAEEVWAEIRASYPDLEDWTGV